MSTETTNKKIKIDNGTTFGRTYTDKAIDERLYNFLQKPVGLTKTELVGVGTNGQENIEIGDNLTLANGKLSASGGGGEVQRITIDDSPSVMQGTYTGTLTNNTDSVLISQLGGIARVVNTSFGGLLGYALYMAESGGDFLVNVYELNGDPVGYKVIQCVLPSLDTLQMFQMVEYNHFITITNSTSTFYFNYQNTSEDKLNTLDSLKTALAGKYLICTGHTDSDTAEYISGENGNIVVGVVDNSDHSTSGITIDSSYTISDDVSPVE